MDIVVKTLGKDQHLWIEKYKSINLNHWRYIAIDNRPDWYYVGEWNPVKITPLTNYTFAHSKRPSTGAF